jgi:hypothetical protein
VDPGLILRKVLHLDFNFAYSEADRLHGRFIQGSPTHHSVSLAALSVLRSIHAKRYSNSNSNSNHNNA